MKLVSILDSAKRFLNDRFHGVLKSGPDGSQQIKAVRSARQPTVSSSQPDDKNCPDNPPADADLSAPAAPKLIKIGQPQSSRPSSASAYSPLTLRPQPGRILDPNTDFRRSWLKELVAQIYGDQQLNKHGLDEEIVRSATNSQVDSIFEYLGLLAAEFNSLTTYAPHRIVLTRPQNSKEPAGPSAQLAGQTEVVYYRGRLSTSSLSLSIRAAEGIIEFFLLPSSDLMLLSQAELPPRLKLKLVLGLVNDLARWTNGGLPIEDNEMTILLLDLFKELVYHIPHEMNPDIAGILGAFEADKLGQAIHNLFLEKQNLVLKIVSQQEEIQNTIARELHDTVISDVMMLKRSLSGDRRLADREVIEVLDKITARLREICDDLAPRDLVDWGLQTVIDDLLQRLGERTGMDCSLNCDSELPQLPAPVQLHIYRIVQECLNNIEKYAQACRVVISMETTANVLTVMVKDNGVGFTLTPASSRRGKEGSRGLGSMQERTELIRCFCPARLSIESDASSGTTISLVVQLGETFAAPAAIPLPESVD